MNNQQSKSLVSMIMPLLAILVLIVVIAWMAGMFSVKVEPGSEQQSKGLSSESLPSFEVEVKEIAQFETVPASVEAKQNVEVSARILARVEKILVSSGEYVTKGQVLIELEKTDLKSRLEQAQAKLLSLTARLSEAKKNLQRTNNLSSKGLVADAQLDAAKANYDAAEADKTNALQAVKEAKAAFDYATIRSPIDGLIIDKFVESGDTIQPAMTILSLYNPESVRVEAHVRESLAVKLKENDNLKVNIPSISKIVSAVIEEIVPAANSASRSFLIKTSLSEVSGLSPGMYAKLMIPSGVSSKILVPEDYVNSVGQLDIVWVDVKGQLVRRFVRVGEHHDNGLIEVVSGLQSGDVIRRY